MVLKSWRRTSRRRRTRRRPASEWLTLGRGERSGPATAGRRGDGGDGVALWACFCWPP